MHAERIFPEGVKRRIGAGLCPEPAEVMGIIFPDNQDKCTKYRSEGGHGSLPFSLLFFLHVIFVLKFLLFERGQKDLVW